MMGKRVLAGVMLAGLICGNAPSSGASPFTPATAAVPTAGATLRLGKCINISNMLEAPREGDWGRAFRDSDFVSIASKGCTGIRLPARFSTHAKLEAPYTIDASFMKRARHITD